MTDAPGSPDPVGADADLGPTTGPPLWILGLAALCVVVAAGLLVVGTFGAQVVGYLAASFVTILLVGAYRQTDFRRHLDPGYRPRPGTSRLISVVLVAAFLVAGLNVWGIATELAT
jgi:hypothetical protein